MQPTQFLKSNARNLNREVVSMGSLTTTFRIQVRKKQFNNLLFMQFYGTVRESKTFFFRKQSERLVKLPLLKKYFFERDA